MNKVLITGGHGFLGRHLSKQLENFGEIIIPTKRELDVENYSQLLTFMRDHQTNVVVHLAALCGGIGANQSAPADFFIHNNLMGVNVLRASHETRVKKLVTLGSVCCYPKFTPVPFKEEDLWSGYPEETNAPYALAKKNLLVGCEAYNQQYGSNFIHLIPVNMYGEYDHFDLQSSHVIPALIRKFHEAHEDGRESVTIWGDGSASREFLYAADCAKAIELALLHYDSPEPVNVGTGMEITIKDLVTKIRKMVGFEGYVIYDESKPNGQPRRCLDITRAQKGFGFKAQTPLGEGLRKTYNWYLKNVTN